MARPKKAEQNVVEVKLGIPNSDAQWRFFTSTEKYVCYGGARGGGKSWAVRVNTVIMALKYQGIKILILRREYGDMENSLISPMLKDLPTGLYNYNKSDHMLTFTNGSVVKFGNMPGYGAAVQGKYQGQEYDILCIDEATQFFEAEFRGLAAIVRGTNKFPKRIYLTCNPGGPGHFWVKRLFIDRDFKQGENPNDYVFIPATVDDNKDLMENDPDYVKALDLLPADIREAHRHGDWNALSGIYFGEFTEGVHTCKPFPIPKHWQHYRAIDYGLDMFFCIWIAVDENGRCYVYRQFEQSNMVVSDAAHKQLQLTMPDERIYFTIAPPDMWSRSKDTGKTMASSFAENGVGLVKADNNRVQGWSAVKELFKIQADGKPNLMIFDTCGSLIECIKSLLRDDTNPNDVRKTPHEITHGPDALRYFCQTRVIPAEAQKQTQDEEEDDYPVVSYFTEMCGSRVPQSYILA